MACVSADGTITSTAKALIKSLDVPLRAEEIAARLGAPLFKVRSSLRELVEAGLVMVQGDKYIASEEGKKKATAAKRIPFELFLSARPEPGRRLYRSAGPGPVA
jgi:predicted transcriptional regulator